MERICLKELSLLGIQSDTSGIKITKKDKAIPVTDHRGPYGCETSRLPHFL
jgi:hypothetical protein